MRNLWSRLTGAIQPKAHQGQQKPLMTVADVIREYRQQRTDEGNLDAARERNKHLTLFSAALGHRPILDVKAHEMLKYLKTNLPGCRSPWTLRRIIVTIKTPFNWAARFGLIDRNPFTCVSQEQGEPGRIMTEAEFRTLLRTPPPKNKKCQCGHCRPTAADRRRSESAAIFRRVLHFIRGVGCRPQECARLEWRMYDEPNARFVLHRHKTSHRRTGKPRVL